MTQPANNLRYIDTHCHFDFSVFDDDREIEWQKIQQAGVEQLIIPATEQATWGKLFSLSDSEPSWHVYLGLHPYFLDKHNPSDLDILQEHLLQRTGSLESGSVIKGIGEIGLDYYFKNLDKTQQHFYFDKQLAIAKEFDLPVIIHARKAYDDVLKYLRKYQLKRAGVIHAFSGSLQQAEQFIALGFKLGFGGALTYQSATRLRATFMELPLSSIIAETDAPDMQPSFIAKGERNSPRNIPQIIDVMADLYGLSHGSIGEQVYLNSQFLL